MKTLFNILQTIFLLVGTIIGAGFITGAELVEFFGSKNFIVQLIFATILMAGALVIVFKKLKSCQSNSYNVENLFGGRKGYTLATCFTSLIFSASMLAGIDTLLNTIVDLKSFQIGSLIVIVVVSIFSKHGVKGMEKLNLILMPIILVTVNILIIKNQNHRLSKAETFNFDGITKVGLYVFMNLFVSVPIMRETVKNKSNKSLLLVSIIVAVIIGIQAYIILTAIKNSNANMNVSMPLYSAIFNGKFSYVYFSLMLTCSLTSVFSAYYPLYAFASKKGGGFAKSVCAIITVIVAKLGLSNIIRFAYPVVGGFGALFFFKCFCRIKDKSYADNNRIKLKREKIMSKRKKNKNKVIKLTDEEYGAYIMALKDERPPKIIRETQQ